MTTRDAVSCNDFIAVARTVRRVCELPAVPTLDWCERVAVALTSLVEASIVRVMLVNHSETGATVEADDSGAADGRMGNEPSRIRAGAAGTRAPLPWWLEQESDTPLRPRAGIFAEMSADPESPPQPDRWWRDRGIAPRIIGLAPIPPSRFGRNLAVEIGFESGTPVGDIRRARALTAALGELSRRALIAFGPEPVGTANRITDRELEVLDMLALGHSVREIADAMGRSPHTVHDHVKSLHRKLRVSSRGELIGRLLGHSGILGELGQLDGAAE